MFFLSFASKKIFIFPFFMVVIVVGGVFWYFYNISLLERSTPSFQKTTRSNLSFRYKINKPSFSAYAGCTWQWKTSENFGIWVQECFLKGKMVTVLPQDGTDMYYYSIKKGGKYVAQQLAIQTFDFNEDITPDEIIDSLYNKFIKSGLIKVGDFCYFEEDTIPGVSGWPIYRLVSKRTLTSVNTSFCGDYGATPSVNKYFMITKKGQNSKAVFVNQMQKNIFDIQSLQILQ